MSVVIEVYDEQSVSKVLIESFKLWPKKLGDCVIQLKGKYDSSAVCRGEITLCCEKCRRQEIISFEKKRILIHCDWENKLCEDPCIDRFVKPDEGFCNWCVEDHQCTSEGCSDPNCVFHSDSLEFGWSESLNKWIDAHKHGFVFDRYEAEWYHPITAEILLSRSPGLFRD